MTPQELKDLITRLGCTPKGREFRTHCKLCGKHSFFVNPGRDKPVVCYCPNCGVEKKEQVIKAMGLTYNDLGQKMPIAEISALWDEAFPFIGQRLDDGNRLSIAASDVRHSVYSYVLRHDSCKLSDKHATWLNERGLRKEEAENLGYRSTPDTINANKIAAELFRVYGESLYHVPGFVNKENTPQLRIKDQGIITPCRNAQCEIEALKVRRMMEGKSGKMHFITSSMDNGPIAANIIHFPFGVGQDTSGVLWVTEGERKADVVWLRRQVPIIGIPGVGVIKSLPSLLRNMNIKHVVCAFDADDAGDTATVQLCYQLLEVEKLDIEISIAKWETGENVVAANPK